MRGRFKPYSEEEKNLLKEIFEHSSKAQIIEKFEKFNRSVQSIFRTAKMLGLKRSQELINQDIFKNGIPLKENYWTEKEIEILLEFYKSNLQKTIEEKLPGRSWKAIVIKARKLGLCREKHLCRQDRELKLMEKGERWSPEENTFLKKIYPNNSKLYIIEQLKKPWTTICRRARNLELHRNRDVINGDKKIRRVRKDTWTVEEENLLKEIYEHNSKDFIMSKIKRPWKGIWSRAYALNLHRDQEIVDREMIEGGKSAPAGEDRWNPQEDQIIIDFYPSSLQKVIEFKLSKRTFRAIRERALFLDMHREKTVIDQDREIKTKKNLMEHYGVDCTLKIPAVQVKSRQTNLDRRGVPYHTQTQEGLNKIKETVRKRFGVDNVSQSKEIQDKIRESFYLNGSQRCSKQQIYIANLLQGKINYPVGNCNVDILLEDKIICEYDGGGHFLSVKLGTINMEEFVNQERKRDFFLKSLGFSIIRIISDSDLIPEDEILFKMINKGKIYLKTGHSWISYDIDRKKVKCIKFYEDYDFGELRKIF